MPGRNVPQAIVASGFDTDLQGSAELLIASHGRLGKTFSRPLPNIPKLNL